MTKTLPLFLKTWLLLPVTFSMLLLLSRCTYHAYYQSPFHANTETYHALPLQSDSLRSASYVSGVFTGGSSQQ